MKIKLRLELDGEKEEYISIGSDKKSFYSCILHTQIVAARICDDCVGNMLDLHEELAHFL